MTRQNHLRRLRVRRLRRRCARYARAARAAREMYDIRDTRIRIGPTLIKAFVLAFGGAQTDGDEYDVCGRSRR